MITMNETNPPFHWVKGLGQWHLANSGEATTRCGSPMLGNNHARNIPESEREKCPDCFPE